MGFFSWNCKGCSESIKAPYGVPTSIYWQNQATCLLPNGSIIIGNYDGYGGLGDMEVEDDSAEWWHNKCWNEADKPAFTGPSSHARDQGYFYDDPEDNGTL